MKLRKIFSAFSLLLLVLFLNACKEDSPSPSAPANVRKTGWQGSDDPSTIPENLNNPFEGDPSTLPTNIDLSAYLPPIGDQGQFGTCVAWATAYNCKTALEAIKFNLSQNQLQSPSYQLSPRYLFTALADDKKGADCNGSDFTPAMELMLTKGVASKAAVPYENLGNCSQALLDPAWNSDAAKHKIKYYRRLDNDVVTLKQALAAKMPVVVGAKLDDSFMAWNSETVYQKGLLQQVNENIGKWGLGLLVVGVLFLIIAVVLIVNTIELAIFSQRFIIKSMQLVGATHWFIQKPFLKRGLWFGFIQLTIFQT